jgi:hypothetical protein
MKINVHPILEAKAEKVITIQNWAVPYWVGALFLPSFSAQIWSSKKSGFKHLTGC